MIDIHSHIISGIDDGARSFEESIALLEKMQKMGIKAVIATPHYITCSKYMENNEEKLQKLQNIKKVAMDQNISISLFLGNEVFIDGDILLLIEEGKVATLNGSRYILIELPVDQLTSDLYNILFLLRSKGFVPIIAHPERYRYLQSEPEKIEKFLEMGCLFQGNVENVVAKYGKSAKKLFFYLLKNNKYHFLATDVHHQDDIMFTNFKKVKKKLIKTISLAKYEELTHYNPLKVLKNEDILGENIK